MTRSTEQQPKPKAYSYLRFSTPEQMRGDSFRRQSSLAAEYAQRHGLDLDTDLTFQDLGVSAFHGRNVETGALGAFLQAVEDEIVEPGSYLLVESLDRISRKVARKAIRILEDIVERGITVVTLNDGREYTAESLDGFDFIMAVLVLIRAHEESATKARRLKAAWHGKRIKAQKGETLTRVTPAWIKVKSDGERVLIPERASVVRRIVKMALSGVGKEAIAEQLNQDGVPTFGRAQFWRRSYIDKILTSPTLKGTLVPHSETYEDGKKVRTPQPPVEGYYPALMDEDEWNRLQAVAAASPLRGRHAKAAMQNVLSGLARCPKCGSTMTPVIKGSGRKGGRPKLVCTKAKAGAGCDYTSVPYPEIEAAIFDQYEYLLDAMPTPDEHLEALLQAAETTVDAIEAKLADLLHLLEARPSDALAARVADLEGHLKDARRERDELRQRAAESEGKAIRLRVQELSVAIRARPRNTRRINAALRALLD